MRHRCGARLAAGATVDGTGLEYALLERYIQSGYEVQLAFFFRSGLSTDEMVCLRGYSINCGFVCSVRMETGLVYFFSILILLPRFEVY